MRRSSENEGSTCEVLFVSWQQVRCHENAEHVHQDVRVQCSDDIVCWVAHKFLQMWVYPNIEPTTIELEVSTPFAINIFVEKAHSTCICNKVTLKVSS